MPLYVVRWPLMRASLVRARDEAQLFRIIDEIAAPAMCTWKVYTGPVWIDFQLPAVRIDEKHPGPLERGEIVVDNPDLAVVDFSIEAPPMWSHTYGEMQAQVRRAAFPRLAKVLNEMDRECEVPFSEEQRVLLGEAIVDDVLRHAEQTSKAGVTPGGDGSLQRTKELAFVKHGSGRLSFITVRDAERFCFGRRPLRPDADGYVRLVGVTVRDDDGSKVGCVGYSMKLRTKEDGFIEVPHRADAFELSEETGLAANRLARRRNDIVQWTLSSEELNEVREAVERKVGRVLMVDREG